VEHDFADIFGLCEAEKYSTANKKAIVYKNQFFDRIKSFGKPLGAISSTAPIIVRNHAKQK